MRAGTFHPCSLRRMPLRFQRYDRRPTILMNETNTNNPAVPSAFAQRKEGHATVAIPYNAKPHIEAPRAWNPGEKELP